MTDSTVSPTRPEPHDAGKLRLVSRDQHGVLVAQEFDHAITIGRQLGCDVVLSEEGISRQHVQVYPQQGKWYLSDLGSVNGTLLAGEQVDHLMIDRRMLIQLGHEGAEIQLEPLPVGNTREDGLSITQAQAHYFKEDGAPAGDQTRLIRRAYQVQQQQQAKKQWAWMSVAALVMMCLLSVIIYQQRHIGKSRDIAVDMFYDMKGLEVKLASAEAQARKSGSLSQLADVRRQRKELEQKQLRYQAYLSELENYSPFNSDLSPEDQIILRIASAFGECELELPPEFAAEVNRYIELWRTSNRLKNALQRMDKQGYRQVVLEALAEYNLPNEFLYLPLQESGYRHDAIGPETYAGIAKGAWQFIPGTATQYGLQVGPKSDERIFDEQDERFDFSKSTDAAAQYLQHLYTTEAQASGLLVLASYNWGDSRVRKLLEKMPANPRERNFWALINEYRIPKETYDYVFYIFSAAVIAEDPELFGFDLEV